MHLGVFVDRLVDHHEEIVARQRQHVLVQVRIAPCVGRRSVPIAIERGMRFLKGLVVHYASHAASS
jgi:hypothetical protein